MEHGGRRQGQGPMGDSRRCKASAVFGGAEMISAAQLLAIMLKSDPGRWLAPLNAAMSEYSVDSNSARTSMFLAQVAEETSGLTQLEEKMGYSAERLIAVWPLHFNATNAWLYANNP